MTKIGIKVTETGHTEQLLAKLPREIRGRQLKAAFRRGCKITAVEGASRVPPPGYPGDKPGKKPLRDTFKVVIREGARFVAAHVGPSWPDGAHGHLVEFGHFAPDGSFVAGKPTFRVAVDMTEPKVRAEIVRSLQRDIKKLGGAVMADIGLTIAKLLAADAPVAAITTRIHSDYLPQAVSARTAVTVTVIDTLHTHTLAADCGVAGARVQVNAFANSRAGANALAEACRLALQSKHRGDNSGTFVNEITVASGELHTAERPEAGGDQRRFVTSIDFFVFYRVAVGV